MLQRLAEEIVDDWRSNGRDWTRPGFRALAVYRFGVWRMKLRNTPLRKALSPLYRIAYRRCRNVYGIELPCTAKVGRGVVIEHQGGIVIHGDAVIGDRCIIRQNCTLGIRSLDDLSAAPVLHDGVELGAGAVVIGRVVIGRCAKIGANAVVLDDVPSMSRAYGAPAKILPAKTKTSARNLGEPSSVGAAREHK